MIGTRSGHAKVFGPKPPSSSKIFGQDLGDLLRIASSPVVEGGSAPGEAATGMSLAEFAAWAGVDRRRLARHLVEVGPGPVPLLPPGKIPVRVFGKTRRILLRDVFGEGASASGGDSYAPGTQETDPSSATLHLEPEFGKLPLKSIDARLIDRYKAEKLAAISQYKRPLSPKTIKNQLGVLHRIFDKAIEYGHIERNPVTKRSWMKTHRTAEDGRPWWRPDEERAVFLALEDWKAEDPHLYFAIKTQLVLGIRFSELRALTKDDLDLRTPGVWMRRAQARKAITTPKNKKARFQVLPRALADELRPWSLRTSGQLLFPTRSGIPLPNNVLNRAYSRLATKAHVRRITSHGARHTSGSSYAVVGAGQKMIATLLGHADMQSTERYTHTQVDSTRAIVEARWAGISRTDR